jgi:RHS repeat-associated protein
MPITINICKNYLKCIERISNIKKMRIYLYLLILVGQLVFSQPSPEGYEEVNTHNLLAQGNYPDTTINLLLSDLINTTSSTPSGTIKIQNDHISLFLSVSFDPQQMKVGVIKNLNITPALPNMELGAITLADGITSNGFYAKIESNALVFYSPFYVTSANANLSADLPDGTGPANGASNSFNLPTIYTCNPAGGGGFSGKIDINYNKAVLTFSGSWSNTCNLKTGQIVYLTGNPIPNTELGIITSGSKGSNFRAKIESNWLVFYSFTTPPRPNSCYISVQKNLNEGSPLSIINDKLNNWIHGVTYDSKGNVTGQSRGYFDDFGKSNVNLSKDYVTNKIWGTQTIYDNFDRPSKTSFVAPSPLTTFDKPNFFKTPAEISASGIPEAWTVTSPVTTSTTIEAKFILGVSAINRDLTVNFNATSILLQPGFNVTATTGSSFKATATIFPDNSVNASVGNYYSDNNTDEPFQATATQPYLQNNYDTLNPDNVINVVGGNKINGDWKTGYSYTVPAAQEMYYAYGRDYYDGPVLSGREEVITKFYKSVSVDENGVENVVFADGEGKVLATARSGGATSYPVVSLIGTQGFVDIHIPAGITSGISLIGGASLYTIYNLKTGAITTTLTGGNAYRVHANKIPTVDPKTYILSNGDITYDPNVLGITYSVNYYEYAINVYNKAGLLIKSIQPKGYKSNSTIVGAPTHMVSSDFATIYAYNALGQVIQTISPDEGTSRFAYRKDGQIRYSQNALQKDTKISYTDYDTYGRAVESGVIATTWVSATANIDGPLVSGTPTEQTITVYDFDTNYITSLADYPLNNVTSVPLPTNLTLSSVLTTAGIPTANYTQNNLSGNVAITYTKPAATITAITWYSYDIYGRTEWMVQYNEGIGAKTIHYYYDYKGNVKKVIYQKDKATELFAHQYTYDANDVLKKVETSTDLVNIGTATEQGTFITHADYSYYQTGELKRVNIAQGLQGLDYVYTLGGQLKSINHPSLEATKDPGGDGNDVFGITLDYYNGDYLRTGRSITNSPSAGDDYHGNIKATRWANKAIAGDFTGSYLYNYDRNNWLTEAVYGKTNSSTAVISPLTTWNEGGLSYDANGNIKKLKRTNETGAIIDDLTYNYNSNNQLNNITDTADEKIAKTDIDSQVPGNYSYNAIGQMTRNNQENINYDYNAQGLVTKVSIGANAVVKFFYNERGQRIKKESYNTVDPYQLQNTDYYVLDLLGNVISIYKKQYDNAIVQTDLPIFGLSRLGVYNRTSATSTYEITDHLGNVRAVVQKKNGILEIPSFADYYPFGEQLPMRNSMSNYRYAFQGQEYDKETDMEAFHLRLWDGRIGRWLSPDPAGQYSSPYLGMGNNPISGVDPDGAKNIRFDESGNYIGVDHDVWWHNLLFGSRGQYSDGNNKWTNFRFNDNDDVARFELEKDDDGYLSGIDIGSFEKNLQEFVDEGIGPAKNLGVFDKYKYIYNQSLGGGSLDYIGHFYSKKLHLFNGIAYNNPDAGNFVWAQSLSQLGISWGDVKFGSEFNGFWNGKLQNGLYSPGNDAWYKRITFLGDSAADQRAIHTGYNTHNVDGKWRTIIYQH